MTLDGRCEGNAARWRPESPRRRLALVMARFIHYVYKKCSITLESNERSPGDHAMNARPDPFPAVPTLSVVEKLAGLRAAAQRRRYAGPTPQLPSRPSILDMADDFLGAVYPRHFGGRDLQNDAVDAYVAAALE